MRLGIAARVGLLVIANIAIAGWVFIAAREPGDAASMRLDSAAQAGHAIWREQGCANCHALFGLGGHAGPDLTNVVRRRGRDYIDAAIRQGVGRMPPQASSAQERGAIVAFLAHVDSLATYPIPDFPDDAFGRIGRAAAAPSTDGSDR